MKKLLIVLLVAVLAWQGYARYQARHAVSEAVELLSTVDVPDVPAARPTLPRSEPAASRFSCDGRTYCLQMHSCEEATYFLKHCPGTKMDGNHDGIPCETQWCR